MQADLHDQASVRRAFNGAYAAYCVTFFWAHMSPEKEFEEARSLAIAANDAGLEHVIWSTLEDTRKFFALDDDRIPTLLDRYKVSHFDVKGEADALFEQTGIPTTYMLASFYLENLLAPGGGPQPDANGNLILSMAMADKKLAGIAAEDIGKCAYGIFKRGPSLAGQRIGIAGDQLTGEEMAEKFSKALGRPVKYNPIPPDVLRSFGFPAAAEIGNMFQFCSEFADDANRTRDVAKSRELNPELHNFDQWLNANKEKFLSR